MRSFRRDILCTLFRAESSAYIDGALVFTEGVRNRFPPSRLYRMLEFARLVVLAYGSTKLRNEQYVVDVVTGRI